MKNLIINQIFLIITIATCVTDLSAQDKPVKRTNSIIIEAGYAFTGTGDIDGSCIAAEYGKYVISKLKVSGLIESMNFLRQDNSFLRSSSLTGIGIHGYYDLIDFNFLKFQIGTGIIYRNWTWIYATGENCSFVSSDGFTLLPSSHDSYKNNTVGYTISVGTLIELNKIVGLNIRGLYQNDTKGDNTVSARIGLNFKF